MLNYEFPPLGGDSAQTTFSLLSEYSAMPDMEVDLVCASVDEKMHMFKMGENITIYSIPIAKNLDDSNFQMEKNLKAFAWQAYWFSRKLAKRNSYEIVHSFFALPCGAVAYFLKKKFKIPYIITLCGIDVPGYDQGFAKSHKKHAWILRKVLAKASFVSAGSQSLKTLMLTAKFENEIELIYDGIDTQIFFADYTKRDSQHFTLVSATHLEPTSGVRILLQAFKILVARYSQMRLIVAGEGSEKKSLEDLARALEILDKVVFVGKLETKKLVSYYQKADLFVNPTFDQNIKKVVSEALACGLPIIATDTDGNREIVEDGKTGFFVRANDVNDLVEKIEKIVIDKKLYKLLEENALERGKEFDWKMIASDYIDLYVKTKNIAHIRHG